MSVRSTEALAKWRSFADSFTVRTDKGSESWRQYIESRPQGLADEEKVVQPLAFPEFARTCLGWTVGQDLAPEEGIDRAGKPDFSPADAVTHPFVFECKGTNSGEKLEGHAEQIRKYLREGAPRIRKVVLINLISIKVFSLNGHGAVREDLSIPLKRLLTGAIEIVSNDKSAEMLADFFDEFSHKELTVEEKIQRVRQAPPWNAITELTNSSWITSRLDHIVATLSKDVHTQISAGFITNKHNISAQQRGWILEELQQLGDRLEAKEPLGNIADYIAAATGSPANKALDQFAAHVAYYTATKLLLVRVWEDLGLLSPMLYDGGFDRQMKRFEDAIGHVVDESYRVAKDRYRSLFDDQNSYSWYTPSRDTYAEVIYDLANTYLGSIQSDVLGQVYERVLERIDRKLLGVYYTPRDIIALMWDTLDLPSITDRAEEEGRLPRILDIATGSGGFLVEAAMRFRRRVEQQRAGGAQIDLQAWLDTAIDGLNGIEIGRFSSFLAELNILVQFGQIISADPGLKLPPVNIIHGDTLSLHDPDMAIEDWEQQPVPKGLLTEDADRAEQARRIAHANDADFLMDIACGNPPYIGEKQAAHLLSRTRSEHPYWLQFLAGHQDYLYYFLILGISKLRKGGRFSFITTEYWLRATGAKPLRAYIAANCQVEKIFIFRDFRLFEDAPGQHSLIITGTRFTGPDEDGVSPNATVSKPRVSLVNTTPQDAAARRSTLRALKNGSSNSYVQSFAAGASPNSLGKESWADVITPASVLRQRRQLTLKQQVHLQITKGNETSANSVTKSSISLLPMAALSGDDPIEVGHGIQLLDNAEFLALGNLSDKELAVLRPVINTKDVYPYAVVLPPDPDRIVYLAQPGEYPEGWSMEAIIDSSPFPPDIPRVREHLERFKPILSEAHKRYRENRPWWALHRPRLDSAPRGSSQSWGDYIVASRWGAGGNLRIGLAPAGSSPASGLNAIKSDDVAASYLAGLYNSSVFQSIDLPPGNLRKDDYLSIGMPRLGPVESEITERALLLADIVRELVITHSAKFPEITQVLREDVTLGSVEFAAWIPSGQPVARTGTLSTVQWIEVSALASGSKRLGTVHSQEESLLGHILAIHLFGSERTAAELSLSAGDEPALLVLARAVRGWISNHDRLADLGNMPVPTRFEDLLEAYESDFSAIDELITRYRTLREEIDLLVEKGLNTKS